MADIVYTGQSAGGPLNQGALPSNNDLVIYKGDYVRLVVNISDSVGAPVVLTGCQPKAVLKSDYSDQYERPFECFLTTNPGEVTIFLSSEVSSTLLPGSYIWDFQITFPDNQTRTYLAGDVTVYDEVTTN